MPSPQGTYSFISFIWASSHKRSLKSWGTFLHGDAHLANEGEQIMAKFHIFKLLNIMYLHVFDICENGQNYAKSKKKI